MRAAGVVLLALAACGDGEIVVVGRDATSPLATAGGGGGASGGAGASGGVGTAGGAGSGGGAAGGGLCGQPGALIACGAQDFCDHTDKACGRTVVDGRCLPRPALPVCPAECNPVCACDGKVYCNECVANNAGVDADPKGTCP